MKTIDELVEANPVISNLSETARRSQTAHGRRSPRTVASADRQVNGFVERSASALCPRQQIVSAGSTSIAGCPVAHPRRPGHSASEIAGTAIAEHSTPAHRDLDARGRPIPGPRGYPLIGLIPEIVRRGSVLGLLREARATYGDTLRLPAGPYSASFFAHPDAVQHILLDNRDNYPRSRHQRRWVSVAVGTGLVASEGAHWRRQRHLMQAPFALKAIAAYAPATAAAVQDVVERWERRLADGQPEIELSDEMVGLAMDALGRSILGVDTRATIETLNEAFLAMVMVLVRQLPDLPRWLPTPDNLRHRRARRKLDAIIDETIRARRDAPDTYKDASDVISHMLRARDEWGEGMQEQHLRDEVLTLYFVGHETTAVGLCWAFYALAQHPDVERQLHEEIDRVLSADLPTAEAVEQLTYTEMVIREALRVYPPITMMQREAREDDQIGGFRVPRGETVLVSPYLTQHHPDFWPDPERFDPERHAPGQAERRHRFSWFPFGGGYHSCIGGAFAMQEMKIAIAMIARRFRLRLIPERPTHPAELITLRPFGGMHMRMERRH